MRELTASAIQDKYRALNECLNERALRLCAAADAAMLGHGGITAVAQASGLSRTTIHAGLRELERFHAGTPSHPERVRQAGAGRHELVAHDPQLLADLERLVDPVTRGDPVSPLCWTCKSTHRLTQELQAQGHHVSQRSVWMLLDRLGYSMQSNRKTHEGQGHRDRDEQFQFIAGQVRRFQHCGQPVISVDTKKKELLGNFKNGGQEWEPKGRPSAVNMYDFADKELGKAIPYGIYDLTRNCGWVSVGITHDTAEFAVESIRRWWRTMGRLAYPKATALLITADSGGSNGSRVRLWKMQLQQLADELGFAIHVCHFPPGTSKWNKIEHRMFCHITQNWRGRPLSSRAVVVSLIGQTHTKHGLEIQAQLDEAQYAPGTKVTDEQMASLRIKRQKFHGEWNYALCPRK